MRSLGPIDVPWTLISRHMADRVSFSLISQVPPSFLFSATFFANVALVSSALQDLPNKTVGIEGRSSSFLVVVGAPLSPPLPGLPLSTGIPFAVDTPSRKLSTPPRWLRLPPLLPEDTPEVPGAGTSFSNSATLTVVAGVVADNLKRN